LEYCVAPYTTDYQPVTKTIYKRPTGPTTNNIRQNVLAFTYRHKNNTTVF
jgi:hypothetical protein